MARVVDSLHETYYVRSYPSFSHHRSNQILRPSPFRFNRSQSPVCSSSSSSTCPRSNSPDSYYYARREGSKMRWLLSFGLFIPAIAAITGVVAWSVSAQMILGSKGEAHLMPSKAAFRFSQGPRDHEWHGLLNNEALETGPSSLESKEDYDLTLDSMTPDPVSISSTSTLTSSEKLPKFNSSSSLVTANSTAATTTITTATSIERINSTFTSVNTTDALTTVAVTTTNKPQITSTASPLPSTGVVKSLVHLKSPNSTIVVSHESVNNTINTVTSNGASSEVKKKKTPGEHVAEVIDKLISERKYESKPKILVVAPPNKKTIDTILANAYTTASASSPSSPSLPTSSSSSSLSSSSATTIALPPVTRELGKVKTSEKSKFSSTIKSTLAMSATTPLPMQTVALNDLSSTATNLYSTTNYPQAVLSKDAETVLAAAHILAARHKIIAMRREDHNSIQNVDTITTPKPPTTPFSRINHMQFPPPRAMQPSSSSSSSSSSKAKQLTQRLHRHDHVHPVVNPTVPPRNLHERMESQQHQHQNEHHSQANPIAMASQAVVTHVLPDGRNIVINHHQQEPIQISPPQPLTVSHHHQVPVFTAASQMGLESQALQQQQLPSPPVRFAQISPHQLPRPPQLHLSAHPHHHPHQQQQPPPPQPPMMSMAQPVPQIPLFQPSIYQSTISPSQQQVNSEGAFVGAMNNNEPVEESQVISHSNSGPNYGGEESKKNTAMVQFHADDHQSSESGMSKGLTLHFGGGPGGGGSQLITSPMGIFKTLLLPLLPKPRMNLNGKVVFGVVLEKGVGFGKQPSRPIYKSHHY